MGGGKGGIRAAKKRLSSAWRRCVHCGREFHPSVYRPDQEYCFRSGFRRASELAARRRYRQVQVAADPDSRGQEAARVARYRAGGGQRRQRKLESADDRLSALIETVVGLTVHLHGDEQEVSVTASLLRQLRRLGRDCCADPDEVSAFFLACTGSGF